MLENHQGWPESQATYADKGFRPQDFALKIGFKINQFSYKYIIWHINNQYSFSLADQF